MEVIFVDWIPIYQKSMIRSGGQIRRYYAWVTLNKMVDCVVPFRKKDGNINWKVVIKMFKKDTKIWVEYGCGGIAHFFVLLASSIPHRRTLILNVHDFAVMQQRDIYVKHPFFQRLRLHIIEHILLKRADVIILPCPGLLDLFKYKDRRKILIMPPGVGEDELSLPIINKVDTGKKIAIYFGSMNRKGAIPKIAELFSELKNWELHLIGAKEGEVLIEKENVEYLGTVSHDKLADILSTVDIIIIPLIKNEYLDRAMHIKLGYALKSCKPVIATKLEGISEYVSLVGLEENVIYVKEWKLNTLKDALRKAQTLNIDPEKTIEKLRPMTWDPRFRKAVEIALDSSQTSHDNVEMV